MPGLCFGMALHKLDQGWALESDMVGQNLTLKSAMVDLESLVALQKVGKDQGLELNKVVFQEPFGLADQIAFGLVDCWEAFGLADQVAFGLVGQELGLVDQLMFDLTGQVTCDSLDQVALGLTGWVMLYKAGQGLMLGFGKLVLNQEEAFGRVDQEMMVLVLSTADQMVSGMSGMGSGYPKFHQKPVKQKHMSRQWLFHWSEVITRVFYLSQKWKHYSVFHCHICCSNLGYTCQNIISFIWLGS